MSVLPREGRHLGPRGPQSRQLPAGDPGFGRALRRVREAARLSQSRLGELAGFDRSMVCRWESGARRPTRPAVEVLADTLRLDPAARDSFLAAAGFMPADPGSLLTGEPEVASLVGLLRDEGVPAERRAAVRSLVGDLVRIARSCEARRAATEEGATA